MTPVLRDGDPLRQASEGDVGDPDHRATHDTERQSGFQAVEFSGYDRPTNVVENEDEIMLEYRRQKGQPSLRCGYCHGVHRARTVEGALRWWNAHDCNTLLVADSEAIVTQLLPLAA